MEFEALLPCLDPGSRGPGMPPDDSVAEHVAFERLPSFPPLLPLRYHPLTGVPLYGGNPGVLTNNIDGMKEILQGSNLIAASTNSNTNINQNGGNHYTFYMPSAPPANDLLKTLNLPRFPVDALDVPKRYILGQNGSSVPPGEPDPSDFKCISNLVAFMTYVPSRSLCDRAATTTIFQLNNMDAMWAMDPTATRLEICKANLPDGTHPGGVRFTITGLTRPCFDDNVAAHDEGEPFNSTEWNNAAQLMLEGIYPSTEQKPLRMMFAYLAESTTGTYPPDKVRVLLRVEDALVINRVWTRASGRPYAYQAGYDPEHSPLPPFAIFFREGGAQAGQSPPQIPGYLPMPPIGVLERDRRRTMDVGFNQAVNVVLGKHPALITSVDQSVPRAIEMHDLYRNDLSFFSPGGAYQSPEYCFPRPVEITRLVSDITVPRVLWEGIPAPLRDRIARVTMRLQREDGSVVTPRPVITCGPIEAGVIGPDGILASLPVDLAHLKEKIKCFSFTVEFDISVWSGGAGGGDSPPMPPVFHDLRVEWKTRRWAFEGDQAVASVPQ